MSSKIEQLSRQNLLEKISIRHKPLKRLFDIFFSLAALIAASPLFLAIAIIIYTTSPGPIFYGHKRIGRGGKTILCWKFRTMHVGADRILTKLLESDPALQKEWSLFYKLKNDPRIISIGHFLRKTSLDELPQFWNVLKGDMSVVGPRPCVDGEVEETFGSQLPKILSIRPGITGLWQTSGRSNTSREKRCALEAAYVDKQSLLLDIKLILKTPFVMIFAKGAH